MKSILPLAGVAILAGSFLAGPAHAATDAVEFASKATVAGKFEIESSKIALTRSKDAKIRGFAQKMIADHMKADKELKAILPKAHVALTSLPKTLDEAHQKTLNDLKAASAEDFDADYVDAQVDAHDEAVSLFEDYAKDGDNESLRKFAAKTLPTLKMHHEKIDQIDTAEGSDLKRDAVEVKDKVVKETKEMGHAVSEKASEMKHDMTTDEK